MLELSLIRRSNSPYINPLVTAIKKDGSVRVCLDARKLNKNLLKDHEAPPSIEEIFQNCQGIKFMSTFDLNSSFHQIPLHEESRKYTAFIFENNIYEFNVVPFGTSTSTAALVRGLDFAIGDLRESVLPFVDDLLCVSRTFEAHLFHLGMLFDRLLKNNLTLSIKKSQFVQQEVHFLGFILTAQGIKPEPEKIQAIKNYQAPKNIKELQGFLGFVNFYTKFAKNYANETRVLYDLLKDKKIFKWEKEQQEAFDKIKELFIENIMLTFADPTKPFILTTDASDFALGAILSQQNEKGDEEVITFISRTLKGPELNYFTTEKEMLAIVWSLNKLETYLRGAEKIIVRTDHEALTFLNNCKFSNDRLRRWNLAMQDYKLYPEYISGQKK